ncbi:MAG: hypothetical protein M3505_00030 [Verrucomicrobiota bacterium]|nr:hypothetical protein [Verrucomicrobiota bacterium]
MRRFGLLLASHTVLLAWIVSVTAAPVARSVSSSRQFIVYGPDAHLRGGICDLAERTKQNALKLLQMADDWRTPIVINAHYPEANLPEAPPATLHLGQTGFGLKLQLDLRVDLNAPQRTLEREILRAVFLEISYRNQWDIAPGVAYVEPPDWLLEGALALEGGRDLARIAGGLNAAAVSGNISSLEDFLRQNPALLESPLRVVYRAYSAALLVTLAEMPGAKQNLARLLADLPRAESDPAAALRSHFSALGKDAEETERIWTASVTRLAASEHYRLLDCGETERQLGQVLHLQVRKADRAPTDYTLEEFPAFVHLTAAKNAFRDIAEELLLLSGRANPLYRPVLTEYQRIIGLLARGKTNRISERLAKARGAREQINRRMGGIEDYMNWFEATQARSTSGAFHDYFQAAELATKQKRHRRDPISVYLDALEAQLQQ